MKTGTIEYQGQLLEINTDRTHVLICSGIESDGTTINCNGHPYRVSSNKKKLALAERETDYGHYSIVVTNSEVSEKHFTITWDKS